MLKHNGGLQLDPQSSLVSTTSVCQWISQRGFARDLTWFLFWIQCGAMLFTLMFPFVSGYRNI